MDTQIEVLLQQYLSLKAQTRTALESLQQLARENCKFKVGDRIRNVDTGKIAQITHIVVDIGDWLQKIPTVETHWIAYPVKKDGEVAKVGEIRQGWGRGEWKPVKAGE